MLLGAWRVQALAEGLVAGLQQGQTSGAKLGGSHQPGFTRLSAGNHPLNHRAPERNAAGWAVGAGECSGSSEPGGHPLSPCGNGRDELVVRLVPEPDDRRYPLRLLEWLREGTDGIEDDAELGVVALFHRGEFTCEIAV